MRPAVSCPRAASSRRNCSEFHLHTRLTDIDAGAGGYLKEDLVGFQLRLGSRYVPIASGLDAPRTSHRASP